MSVGADSSVPGRMMEILSPCLALLLEAAVVAAAGRASPYCSRFNRRRKGNIAESGRSNLSPLLPVENESDNDNHNNKSNNTDGNGNDRSNGNGNGGDGNKWY